MASVDIPNAFMQTDMEGEQVIMKLRGKLAKMMGRTSTALYRPHLTMDNGKKVLYLDVLNVLYGCL